jgi:hypothetical protein
MNAWWELELDQVAEVNLVTMYNSWSHCCMDRIAPFNLTLLSSTREHMAIQNYDQVGEATYTWSGVAPNVRFVRVQLDGHSNFLHLAEVQVSFSGN